MTEIEKMYENANAYKMLCNCEFKNLFDYSIGYGQDVCIHAEDEIRKGCEGCELAEQNVKYYPPFSADKQLEITKFIGLHYGFQMLKNEAFDYIIATKIFVKYELEYKGYGYGYDEAIANLINNLWQSLTNQEKEEIRNILNA